MSEKNRTGSRSQKRARRRRLQISAAAVLLLAIGLGLWKGRAVFRWFKQKRAVVLVEESRQLMEAESWREALIRGGEAYSLAPEDPQVIRLMSEITSMSSRERQKTLYFIRRLRDLGALELEDRKREIRVLTALGKSDEGRKLGEGVLKDAPSDAESYELMANILMAEGEGDRAMRLYEQSLELDPENLETRLRVAAYRTESSFAEMRQRGWDEIWAIAQDQSDSGLRALEFIGGMEKVPIGKEQAFVDLLENHPGAEERHQLMALKWRVTIDPLKRAEILAQAIEERSGRKMTEIIGFLDWLNRIGEPQPLLEVLTLENSKTERDLFALYLNALGRLERWADIEAALESENVPLSTGQLHFTRARVMRQQGVEGDSLRDEISKAVQYSAVEKQVGLAFQSAVIAEELGYYEVAMVGYGYAADNASLMKSAYEKMFELASRANDTEKIGEIFQAIDEKNLDVPQLVLEGAYFNLLVGNGIEVFRERARALVEARPDDSLRWLVLGLGHFRMMDREGCAEACSKIDGRILSPGKRAVFSYLLRWLGDDLEAQELSVSVPTSLLLDEERRLFETEF